MQTKGLVQHIECMKDNVLQESVEIVKEEGGGREYIRFKVKMSVCSSIVRILDARGRGYLNV